MFTYAEKMDINRKFQELFPNFKQKYILTVKNKVAIILGRKTKQNALVARKRKMVEKALVEKKAKLQRNMNIAQLRRKTQLEIQQTQLKYKKDMLELKLKHQALHLKREMQKVLRKKGKTLTNRNAVIKYLNAYVQESPNHSRLREAIKKRVLASLDNRFIS
jgi:hypothetical protein